MNYDHVQRELFSWMSQLRSRRDGSRHDGDKEKPHACVRWGLRVELWSLTATLRPKQALVFEKLPGNGAGPDLCVQVGRRQGFESKTHGSPRARKIEQLARQPFTKLEVSKRPKRTDLSLDLQGVTPGRGQGV